jgi:hypothetical protein
MNDPSEFDSRPDPALGARIRDALDGPDAEAFVARLRSTVAEAVAESSWDVLTRWAPRGMIAAAAAAALIWALVRPAADPGHDEMVATSAPVSIELSPAQPEYELLATALLEGR